MSACVVCGDTKTVARERCMTCWKYHRRNGSDRTYKHVARLTQRDIERESERRRG